MPKRPTNKPHRPKIKQNDPKRATVRYQGST